MKRTSYCAVSRLTPVLLAACVYATPAAGQSCSLVCHGELARTPDGSGQVQLDSANQAIEEVYASKGKEAFERVAAAGRQIRSLTEARDFVKAKVEFTDRIPVLGSTYGAIAGMHSWALDRLTNAYVSSQERAIDEMLAEINFKDASAINSIRQMSPADQYKYFWGADGQGGIAAGTTIGSFATAETRAALAATGVDLLNRRVSAFAAVTVRQQGELEQIGTDLNKLTSAFDGFREAASRDIADLQRDQAAQQRTVDRLVRVSGNNSARLDTLERVLFDQMPPEQRLALIERNGFPGITLSQKEIDDLRKSVVLSKVQEYAQRTGAAAGDLAAIGNVLGVDISREASLVQTAAQVVGYGTLLMSGEPFSMLSGAGGIARMLGGGGGGDATAAQINALRSEMRAYHQQTMGRLDKISSQIDEGFRSVLASNDRIFGLLSFVSAQTDEILSSNLWQCRTVAGNWQASGNDNTYDARVSRLRGGNGVQALKSCADGLSSLPVLDRGKARVSTVFRATEIQAEGYSGDENGRASAERESLTRWRNQVLLPTLNFTMARAMRGMASSPNCSNGQTIFAALTSSSDRMGELRLLLQSLAEDCAGGKEVAYRAYKVGVLSSPVDVDFMLSTLLRHDRIVEIGGYALEASSVFEFVRGDAPDSYVLANRAEIAAGNTSGTEESEQALRFIIDLASFGIAQSSLLAGDLILAPIGEDIETALKAGEPIDLQNVPAKSWENCDASASKWADYFNAICVLQHNAALRYNFTRFWIDRHRKSSGYASYSAGTSYDRPALIQAELKELPIERCDADPTTAMWCLALPMSGIKVSGQESVFKIALPEWEEVATERLAFGSPDRADLISLRAKARNQLYEYEIGRKLTTEEISLVQAGIVLEARAAIEDRNAATAALMVAAH